MAPHFRRKTCPSCRAPVRARPTPAFLVRAILSTVSPSLDPEAVESALPRGTTIIPGGEPPDPWQGIFPKENALGRANHPEAIHEGIIHDHEDGVIRCFECLYEIFDGVCQGCGRIFDDHDDLGSEGSMEDDHDFPAWVFQAHHPHPFDGEDDDGPDDDIDEDEYGGSFIDDDEYNNEIRHAHNPGAHELAIQAIEMIRRAEEQLRARGNVLTYPGHSSSEGSDE